MTGYPDSASHVRDELGRADLLVRAQVEWFRLGLGAAKPPAEWGLPSVGETEVTRFLERPGPTAEPDPLPAAVTSHLAAAREAADRIAERVKDSKLPLRLPELVEACALDQHERDVLLLCLLSEVDDTYRRIFGYLADDATITGPTPALAVRTVAPELSGTGWGRSMFAAGRSLVRHRLVEVTSSGTLRLDPRIAAHLLDDDTPDDRVAHVLTPSGSASLDELVLEPDFRDSLRRLARVLADKPGSSMVLLHGPYGSGRHTVVSALCTNAGRPMLSVDVAAALREPWPRVVELCYREAMLRGAALCWVGVDPLVSEEHADKWSTLLPVAAASGVLTLMTGETAWDPAGAFGDGDFLRIDLTAPGFAQRRRLWQAMLPPDTEFASTVDRVQMSELLANTFQLTAGQIVDAVGTARGVARVREPDAPLLRVDDLYEGCRRQSGRRLVAFATRIEPRTELTFDDLILPAANRRQLEELRGRITLRGKVYGDLGFDRRLSLGRGVVAMFTGGSGTGKTMAAELLAREQGADLYKVDLSAVASKYVGETEKNLDRVFEDAERTNAMIFFDEADALFAKRGEVKEARDRWANVEMAFLLQRVEEFRGVVVLASNLRQNIDNAFLRRLHAVVDFPAPDPAARLRIWQGMFPSGLTAPPTEDLSALAARFPLSGGSIRNVVLDAAFRALQGNSAATSVDLRDLTISVGREYQKLGLPVTPGEFGQPFYGWIEHELLVGEPNGR